MTTCLVHLKPGYGEIVDVFAHLGGALAGSLLAVNVLLQRKMREEAAKREAENEESLASGGQTASE